MDGGYEKDNGEDGVNFADEELFGGDWRGGVVEVYGFDGYGWGGVGGGGLDLDSAGAGDGVS